MFLTILAEGDSGSGGSGLVALLPFVLIAVAMYFLLIRPQRRRMAQQRELSSAVEEGDEIMTTAGVYGFVTAIDGDVIWLEIAEDVQIRIARQAVSRRIPPTEAEGGATDVADSGEARGDKDASSE
jgi:preprotein translocase subunit YajC